MTLGAGTGLHKGQGLDDYAGPQACARMRESDEKTNWSRLSIYELNHCHSSLSFFDAEGMRFHLPAFLMAELRDEFKFNLVFCFTDMSDYRLVAAKGEQSESSTRRQSLEELVKGMNDLIGNSLVDYETLKREVKDRDLQLRNAAGKDAQLAMIRQARALLSEKLVRVAKPSPILARENGPLIAVKLNILTRKSLGGLETDLSSRVLGHDGQPIIGLYAAGEVAGFGGGGVHGYRALEGTFLGGCIFGGRIAGRAAVKALG